MNDIEEKNSEQESFHEELVDEDDDEGEEFGRSEDKLDLDQVEVGSTPKP
jgi:hypothetical protein